MRKMVGKAHWVMVLVLCAFFTTAFTRPVSAAGVTITPAGQVVAGSTGSWEITYPVLKETTGVVRFFIPSGWSPPQNSDPKGLGYVSVIALSAKAVVETQVLPYDKINDTDTGPEPYCIEVRVKDGVLQPSDEIKIVYGDTTFGSPGAMAGTASWHVYPFTVQEDLDNSGVFDGLEDYPILSIVPAPAAKITLRAPTNVQSGKSFSVMVVVKDAYGNAATDWKGSATITLTDTKNQKTTLPQTTLTFSDKNSLTQELALTGIPDGTYWITAEDVEGKMAAEPLSATIVTSSNSGTDSMAATATTTVKLFGDIHGHSNLSDTTVNREPSLYLASLKNTELLNFGAVTDHDHIRHGCPGSNNCCTRDFKLTGCTGVGYSCSQPIISSTSGFWDGCNKDTYQSEWEKMKDACDSNYTTGFISILGYEWSSTDRTGFSGYGHKNVYYFPASDIRYSEWTTALYNNMDSRYDTPSELWGALGAILPSGARAFTIPHHVVSEPPSETNWSFSNATHQRLVEIYSQWGNAEYPASVTPSPQFPACQAVTDISKYIRYVLTLGAADNAGQYRLGIIAGSDSHHDRYGGNGPPTTPEPLLCSDASYGGYGLAAAIVDYGGTYPVRTDLSNAFNARHVYATTGDRILLDFKIINSASGGITYRMGDETSSALSSPNLSASIVVTAQRTTDSISNVDVFWWNPAIHLTSDPASRNSNWANIHSPTPNANHYGTDASPIIVPITSSMVASGWNIYYLRAYVTVAGQTKKEVAWSSPIWIKKQ